MKGLLIFLFKYKPGLLMGAMSLGALAGIANTSLIALIHQAMANYGAQPASLFLGFMGLCLALPIIRMSSVVLVTFIVQKAIFDLRLTMSTRILRSPLRRLEELGAPKLLATLTTDVNSISMALSLLPNLSTHVALLLGSLAYLFYLFWPGGVGILIGTVFGVGLFRLIARFGHKSVGRAREVNDTLYTHFRSLTEGTKELKMSRTRREHFIHESLTSSAGQSLKANIRSSIYFGGAGSVGQTLFFVAIGVMIFVVPELSTSFDETLLSGYSLVLLYMIVPLMGLMNSVPMLARAGVSFGKVQSLGLNLDKMAVTPNQQKVQPLSFKTLELKGLIHAYHVESEDELFTLGPINLSFKPGELVLLVGGNGSGKTTLAKLLMGLYHSDSGEIIVDGQTIKPDQRDNYRQYFSSVFSDFFLFETLLNKTDTDLEPRVEDYLKKLHLQHKVKLADGNLSTLDLSQGQRKRLTLLNAYLEDRPIYVFDEWASDQDPVFKDLFYKTLLPELKARGKTVIAISHDDQYFPVADRLIKLDYGQIAFDRPVSELDFEKME